MRADIVPKGLLLANNHIEVKHRARYTVSMGMFGNIGDYIGPVAVKRLAPVDIDATRSNQHEFGDRNGAIKAVLGARDRKESQGNGFDTTVIYFSDECNPITSRIKTSWYDTRRNQPNRSPEWRLYYKNCRSLASASVGDLMFLTKVVKDGRLLIVIVQSGSSMESQISALFRVGSTSDVHFDSKDISNDNIDVYGSQILDAIGVPTQPRKTDLLDKMIYLWGNEFPSNAEFAKFSQSSLSDVDPAIDDPDEVLIAYYEQEYKLFKIFEEAIIGKEYRRKPFVHDQTIDVEAFTRYYTKVRNRRMSRAGTSLEQHVFRILHARNISFDAQAHTENNKRPDFLFPSQRAYDDPSFPADKLRMLAVKTSLKDRFRQVADEANRITYKHLLSITPNDVTDSKVIQMDLLGIILVMPDSIRKTYKSSIAQYGITFTDFVLDVARYSMSD